MLKGTFYLMGSQVATVLANYVIHIFLARYLGPAVYGSFGVLMSLYFINRTFLGTGVPKAVSKFISEKTENLGDIFITTRRLQIMLAGTFGLLFILLAGPVSKILNDPSLVPYIRFLGVLVIPLSLIPLYTTGFLNGLKQFRKQAIIRTIYPVLRVVFSVGLVYLGFALWGALLGFLLSLIVGLMFCWMYVKIPPGYVSTKLSKKVIKFAFPVTVAALGITLIRQMNVLFLQSLLADSSAVGYYTAAATLANVPFTVFSALPLALLPSISYATSAGKMELSRKYIRQSLRLLWLLLLPVTLLVVAFSEKLILLFFNQDYVSAAPVLQVLIWGSTFMVFLLTFYSLLTGSGKPKQEMFFVSLLLGLMIIGNFILIPEFGLIGAALSFSGSALCSLLLVGVFVYHRWKALFSLKSFVRITLLSVVVYFLANWQLDGLWIILQLMVLMVLYFIFLALFGELGREDVLLIQKLFKRKSKGKVNG